MKNMKMNTCSIVTYSGNLGIAKTAISIEGALRWGCTTYPLLSGSVCAPTFGKGLQFRYFVEYHQKYQNHQLMLFTCLLG